MSLQNKMQRYPVQIKINNMDVLVDRYGRIQNYLRISLTDRCNFNCVYCIPKTKINWYPQFELLTYEEIIRIITIFSFLGINKIRFTGGEPLLRKGIEKLISEISHIKSIKKIGITTNAYFLQSKWKALKYAGLNSINISLDTLDCKKFCAITGRNNFKDVLNALMHVMNDKFESVKINVVIIKGLNDNEIIDFINFFKHYKVSVRFIEFMLYGKNNWDEKKYVPGAIIKEKIESHYKLTLIEDKCGHSVSKDYNVLHYPLKVGFINSNSEPFCESCSRLRLTSNGSLKLCLYDSQSYDIKSMLRNDATDEEISNIVKELIMYKNFHRPILNQIEKNKNAVMTQIGG